jgi:hypothetical protein
MTTREEAEAKADAIMAAHRQPVRAPASGGAAQKPFMWRSFLVAGFLAGAVAAVLPAHSFIIGGIVGLALAGVVAVIASRLP